MDMLNTLIKLFVNNVDVKFIENFHQYYASTHSRNLIIPPYSDIIRSLEGIPDRDTVEIEVKLDDGVNAKINLNKEFDYSYFVQELNSLVQLQEENSIFSIYLNIYKHVEDKRVSIYKFDSFVEYLNVLSLKGIIFELSRIKNSNDYIVFDLFDVEDSFNSCSFYFTNEKKIDVCDCFRSDRLSKRIEICSFFNSSEYDFIAEDFYLINKSKNKDFNRIMDKLTIVFSLISICNISRFENDYTLWCRLDGYKSIVNMLKFNEMNIDEALQYYQIHKWLYTGGNLSDKAGLARNIISIHTENNDLLKLEGNILVSIKSAHEIYLKQNVQQYIEVKNKVIESLDNMSQKASDMVQTFTNTLKQNFLGIITFFVSTIVINALSGENSDVIFSKDISKISYGLLVASLMFLFASVWEINQEIVRFKDKYKRLKKYYCDILDPGDIKQIFHDDEFHNKDVLYISSKKHIYSAVWIVALIIFMVIVFYCSTSDELIIDSIDYLVHRLTN